MRGLLLTAVLAAFLAATASSSTAAPAANVGAAVGVYLRADRSAAALVLDRGELRLVDYRSGALRQLAYRSPNVYVGGPGVSVPAPVSVQVALGSLRRGVVAAVTIDGQRALRMPFVTKQAAFRDGEVRLAGRLLLPSGRGPFPAVVIVPGSVPAHRDTYDLWAYYFASRGFAVLTYDKRGVGASTGRYDRSATDANLHDLAGDALAAVSWLARRPEIDRRRIGLSGGSQAGWVIEIAASESAAVRFAALQSGPAMSVGRQLAYSGLTKQGAVDVTDEQIRTALNGVPDSGFDPKPALEALTIPVLWQLGTVDKRMYTPESVAALSALARAGHAFTIRLYPGGAHSLRLTDHGLIAEERRSPGFVPGVFADLGAWLRAHVRA